MWQSNFTRSYGLDYPFVAAGMGFLSLPELVAAISQAGGLGLLGAAPVPAPVVRQMIRDTRALTDRPFGVDLIVEDLALGPATTEEHIDVCAEEEVPVAVFFWNPPPERWLERLRDAGTRTWMTVGSIAQARVAQSLGFDAVIAQGSEAGGHNKSALALTSLVPALVDSLDGLPVIAAGGIADGRGVAAALALGADAVCVGTRLVASEEAYAHEEFKRRIVAASVDDVALTSIFGPEWPHQPMKVVRNRVVEEWQDRSGRTPADSGSDPIGSTLLVGQPYDMPRFSAILPTPDTRGDFDEMCIAAGESAGLVRGIEPAADIMRGMMSEAAKIVSGRLAELVS